MGFRVSGPRQYSFFFNRDHPRPLAQVPKAVVSRTLLLLGPEMTVWHSRVKQQVVFTATVHHFSDLGVMTPPRNLPYENEEVRGRFVAVALAVIRKMADSKKNYPLSAEFLRLLGPAYEEKAVVAENRVLQHLQAAVRPVDDVSESGGDSSTPTSHPPPPKKPRETAPP